MTFRFVPIMSFITISFFLFCTNSSRNSSKDLGKVILHIRSTGLFEDSHEALCLSDTSEQFNQPFLLFLIIFFLALFVFLIHTLHLLLCHGKTFLVLFSLQCFCNLSWKGVNICLDHFLHFIHIAVHPPQLFEHTDLTCIFIHCHFLKFVNRWAVIFTLSFALIRLGFLAFSVSFLCSCLSHSLVRAGLHSSHGLLSQ